MTSYDTIILGSSPNALTTAAYLARGGKKVLVLEPTEHIGGAASTKEFAPGFKGDQSFLSGRLNEDIVKELKLKDHGLEGIERSYMTSLLPGGSSFTIPADRDEAVKLIGGFAPRDAQRYKQFMQLVDMASEFLLQAYKTTPPQQHPPTDADAQQLSALVGQLKGYGKREMTEVMRLLVMSVRDLLDEWFENPELKGILAAPAIRGLSVGPFAGSTAFNLLHHIATGDGYFRATAKGGIGAISAALAKAAKSYGAEVRTNVGPLKLITKDGSATGVKAGSEEFTAATIVSDYDALHTFSKLVAPPDLEPEFNRALKRTRYKGSVTRINLALKELPKFTGNPDALKGSLTVSPSLAFLENTYDATKRGGTTQQPFLDVAIPSMTDPTVAPSGQHVMSIWMQYTPYNHTMTPEQACDLALARVNGFFDGIKSFVLHKQILMPRDFESQFNLSEGQLYGGEVNLAQAFYLRPIPGFSNYHTPIANLYLCGAATHPGGGVHGLCGRNAAHQIEASVKEMVPA